MQRMTTRPCGVVGRMTIWRQAIFNFQLFHTTVCRAIFHFQFSIFNSPLFHMRYNIDYVGTH